MSEREPSNVERIAALISPLDPWPALTDAPAAITDPAQVGFFDFQRGAADATG
jgi:hypothetical protein